MERTTSSPTDAEVRTSVVKQPTQPAGQMVLVVSNLSRRRRGDSHLLLCLGTLKKWRAIVSCLITIIQNCVSCFASEVFGVLFCSSSGG